MNPEEQIAALKQEIEALKDELYCWKATACSISAKLYDVLYLINKDRTDRINQLPPEYARGIAKP